MRVIKLLTRFDIGFFNLLAAWTLTVISCKFFLQTPNYCCPRPGPVFIETILYTHNRLIEPKWVLVAFGLLVVAEGVCTPKNFWRILGSNAISLCLIFAVFTRSPFDTLYLIGALGFSFWLYCYTQTGGFKRLCVDILCFLPAWIGFFLILEYKSIMYDL